MWESLWNETAGGDRRDELVLNWSITLLEDGRPGEAGEALDRLNDRNSGRARLRAGLVAYAQGELVLAEEILAQVDMANLPGEEYSWYYYMVNGS